MIGDFLTGASCALRGTRLIARKELRRFVYIPLCINVLVFSVAIWLGITQFDALLEWLLPGGNSWWVEYARTALWVFFTLIVLLILFFTFSVLANILGAPFNGLLSEKVEDFLTGEERPREVGTGTMLSTVVPSITSEIKKLVYYLSIGIGIFLLLLIPGIGILSPVLWTLYASWMLAMEYTAYPMENHSMYFSQIRSELKKNKSAVFGFGLIVMIMSTLPVINFFVMPAAVSGATALWVEHLKER